MPNRKSLAVLIASVLPVFAATLALSLGASAAEFEKGPYLQDVAPTGITVIWETDKPDRARLDYGTTEALGKTMEVPGRDALRKVRLEHLQPAARYYYRATEGDAQSPIYTFQTMPVTGAFTFVVYGDSRSNPGDHARVVREIQKFTPAFVLHTGDLVGDGDEVALWGKEFFTPAQPLIAATSLFAAIGNHEEESPNFYKYFGSPTGEPWCSFDCVNAHFVILDTSMDMQPGSPQYSWLENDLASTDKRWRFVVLHTPLYSSGSHGSNVSLRQSIEPILQKHKVDVVFAGHDHHYERTFPIADESGGVHAITHIVTGGGGAPLREVKGDFFTAAKASVLNFCVVTIDSDNFSMTAYDASGAKIDSFEIVKSADGYANDYRTRTASWELANFQSLLAVALKAPPIEYSDSARTLSFEFQLDPPAWGSAELEVTWKAPEGVTVTPEKSTVKLAADESEILKVTLSLPAGATKAPTAQVKVKTRFGDVDLAAAPFRIVKK